MKITLTIKRSTFIPVLFAVLMLGCGAKSVFAQTSSSTAVYVPLIGITSVPDPLALPKGGGSVTYQYFVKNFLAEAPLADVQVVDNKCAPVTFLGGDDNGNAELDYGETWRYACATKIFTTTESIATATGIAHNITAAHSAYATVAVGSAVPPPLVSIVDITKVAYPLSLPRGGGSVTFTYKVTNPGVVPLNNVTVSDNECSAMSGELGDTNDNHLLDPNEVWTYTCTTVLARTTTNTATATAHANGLKAIAQDTITVNVAVTNATSSPIFMAAGANPNAKVITWEILSGILAVLIVIYIVIRKRRLKNFQKRPRSLFRTILLIVLCAIAAGIGYYFLILPPLSRSNPAQIVPDALNWKFPITETRLPSTGNPEYSSITVPGGVPEGLPVRLLIPVIGVDSGIEDGFITPDGRMQVPAGTADVAWFALGPHPGQAGSAVIGGHFGIQNEVPFVFYNLNKLAIGDKIYVVNDEGDTLSFIVRSIASFGLNDDATSVFTSSDGLAHLNLITCEGVWNAVDGDYPDRLVIFTDEIPTVGAVPVAAISRNTFPRSLSMGASGPDVSALQTVLEQKGFLTMPPAVDTGYFGALTSAAVSAYQTTVGLPPIGVFGPLTRAELISQLATNSVLPATGMENSTTLIGTTVSSPKEFTLFMESLDTTPLDGLILFLLFGAIVFMAVEIIGL